MGYKNFLSKGPVFTEEIDKYFLDQEFELDVMNPRHWHKEYEGQFLRDAKCLSVTFFHEELLGKKTVHLFLNRREVYMEIQNQYGEYSSSYYHRFEKGVPSLEEIERVLDSFTDVLE